VLLLEVVGDHQLRYSEGRTSCSYPTDKTSIHVNSSKFNVHLPALDLNT